MNFHSLRALAKTKTICRIDDFFYVCDICYFFSCPAFFTLTRHNKESIVFVYFFINDVEQKLKDSLLWGFCKKKKYVLLTYKQLYSYCRDANSFYRDLESSGDWTISKTFSSILHFYCNSFLLGNFLFLYLFLYQGVRCTLGKFSVARFTERSLIFQGKSVTRCFLFTEEKDVTFIFLEKSKMKRIVWHSGETQKCWT